MKKIFLTMTVFFGLIVGSVIAEEDHNHEEDNHLHETITPISRDMDSHDHEEETLIEINAQQRAFANIQVSDLRFKEIYDYIDAPGEMVFNAYRSSRITPRINAQVVKRYVHLGQKVKRGQVLVSLSSVAMAEAQGQLLVADREWQRVKKLGRKVVSDRRYVAAQVAREQAYAKVLAFGMTKKQIEAFIIEGHVAKAIGRFDLLANRSGTITSDEFIVGEIVEPGKVLFDLTDESVLWVEARLSPEQAYQVQVNASASIRFGQSNSLTAKVIQVHHVMDENTRTLAVRLAVDNPDDVLHPGLFVGVSIQSKKSVMALAVSQAAVLRNAEGDWIVFVEEKPDHFKPQRVNVIRTVGDQVVIDGVKAYTRVVTQGAFFVQSELAKGGFDIHNH